MDDTTCKGTRGTLPAEELIVGLFDAERGSGVLWSPEEFNEFAPRALTDADIQSVRTLRVELFHQWFAIAPAQKFELKFELTSAASS